MAGVVGAISVAGATGAVGVALLPPACHLIGRRSSHSAALGPDLWP